MTRLLHIIESFGVGGAEQVVAGVINGLEGYEHHLLILNEPDQLRSRLTRDHSFLNLNIETKFDLLLAARKVKQYIRKNKIDIVHSHLYWGNILSRLAVPRNVPVYNSIHAISSQAAYQRNKLTLYLEKLTYRKRHYMVGVSQEVLNDFRKHVGLKGRASVLYNFVEEKYFAKEPRKKNSNGSLKLVAVGNLRYQKNYPYLLDAMKKLPATVTLDIYGEGTMRAELQKTIDENKLPVRLCGLTNNLHELLPQYDAFVMSSFFEGQPLSLLEAMAAGLPAILADIPVLREVTGQDAVYFNIGNTDSFVNAVQSILDGQVDLNSMCKITNQKVH